MEEFIYKIWKWIWNDITLFEKLPILLPAAYGLVIFVVSKFRDYSDDKSLFPYYSDGATKKARKNYIRTKCQNIDPSDEINLKSSFAFAAKEDLLNFFFR